MSIGEWSDLLPYDTRTVDENVDDKPGVYRLSRKEDDKYHVFYVGKADVSLRKRLKDHLSDWEPNLCIKKRVKGTCRFRFVYVTTQEERNELESEQIKQYDPECNRQGN